MSPTSVPPYPTAAVDRTRVVVLLCTFNEVENLPPLFAALEHHLPDADILVVDDSSPDGTGAIVKNRQQANPKRHGAAKVHLLTRAGKQGLGSATREGLQWCVDQAYDFVIQMDADLSHDPADAPRLLAACLGCDGPEVDVAIGSRYVQGGKFGGLSWHRKWISRTLNHYATRLLQLPVCDCSGSFRCYRVSRLRSLQLQRLQCQGYGFLEEILVGLFRAGARLRELPIEFQHRARGHSKLGFSDAVGALLVIHRLAVRRAWESEPSSPE